MTVFRGGSPTRFKLREKEKGLRFFFVRALFIAVPPRSDASDGRIDTPSTTRYGRCGEVLNRRPDTVILVCSSSFDTAYSLPEWIRTDATNSHLLMCCCRESLSPGAFDLLELSTGKYLILLTVPPVPPACPTGVGRPQVVAQRRAVEHVTATYRADGHRRPSCIGAVRRATRSRVPVVSWVASVPLVTASASVDMEK